MDQRSPRNDESNFQGIYDDIDFSHINDGSETIHAKRLPGRFRNLKWAVAALWILYFIGPYVRWNGRQALLFDIPGRQFHFFSLTIHPQDVWLLTLVLILMAMVLFGAAAVAGRVFCGYFCFQTVWTDIFGWIEARIEGTPQQRRKLDQAPWSGTKLRKKGLKHLLWLLIAALTGVTFAAYFTDALQLWHGYLTLSAPLAAWVVLGMFIFGTYVLAGFMREQVCFWLCPYARIQGVMYDRDTVLPTYDTKRGEPRGKLKAASSNGDCIDCRLCVAVCPTGIDIRQGQQDGCITCGLCIDACDGIMERIGRDKGLIRYASAKEMAGEYLAPLLRRPRLLVYSGIISVSLLGIIHGLANIPPIEWSVLHQRQPLYTLMSDGTVQNRFTFKIFNKTKEDVRVRLTVEGIDGVELAGGGSEFTLKPGRLVPFDGYIRADPKVLPQERTPFKFVLETMRAPQQKFLAEGVMIRPAQGPELSRADP